MHETLTTDTPEELGRDYDKTLLSIIYGNGRSLGSHPGKIEVLKEAARREEADILLISEAGYVDNGVQSIEGFDIAGNQPKQVRSGAFAAGVTAWTRKASSIKILYKNCIEHIGGFQAIELHTNKKMTIVVFYRSPNQEETDIIKTGEYFESLEENVYLLGDLNVPEACWRDMEIKGYTKSKTAKENVIDALTCGGYRKQIITFPTRKDNILDIVIIPTNSEADCRPTISPEATEERAGTDHEWIWCGIKSVPNETGREQGGGETYEVNKIPVTNYDIVQEIIDKHQWVNHPERCEEWNRETYIHDETNCVVCEFINLCQRALKEGTTYKIKKKNRNEMGSLDEAIAKQTEITLALKRIKMRSPTQYNCDRWKHQSKILNEMCDIRSKQTADRFVSKLDKDKNAIYRPISEQSGGQIRCLDNEDGVTITEPKEVGNILANHMCNKVFKKSNAEEMKRKVRTKIRNQNRKREKGKIKIFRIDEKLVGEAIKEIKSTRSVDANGISNEFILKTKKAITWIITSIGKLSFNSGIIPDCLKKVIVVPIPKKSKANLPSKVRPINLCSNIVKIWERVAKKQIENILKENNFFNPAQHGFRNDRSTITCLAKINHKLEECVDEGAYMICLDFAKAFDTVDHEVLIQEMGKAGVEHTAYEWMSNWILGDKFQCRIGNTLSDPKDISSGCKQGSCLGPLAFIVFINSLLDKLPRDSTFGYADDLTIIIPYGRSRGKKEDADIHNKRNEDIVQGYLDACSRWSERTGLRFNTDKCYIIGIGRRRKPDTEFRIANEIITTPDNNEVTVLGLNFTGGKKDYLASSKRAAKRSGGLVFKRLKTLYRATKFRHIKHLYHIYYTSKALYGSEIMEDYTWKNGSYTKEDRWTKRLDTLFKKLFIGKLPTKSDLEKGKKKNYTNNYELDAIPFLPSQICLIKTLTLVFRIIGGHLDESDLTLNQMTTSRENRTNTFTRSQSLGRLGRELGEESTRNKTLIRRHNSIIKEIMKSEKFGTIQYAKPAKQKHMIKQYVSGMKSEENEVRLKISQKLHKLSTEEKSRMVGWKVARQGSGRIAQ